MTEPYFAPPAPIAADLSPGDLVGACLERGASRLLLDDGALPPAFFDLSSGLAGELVQKLTNYGIRTAGVAADPGGHSEPFRDFVRESARSAHFRLFASREAAVEWLTAESVIRAPAAPVDGLARGGER